MTRIGEGIGLSQVGEWYASRELFAQFWADLGGETGDPLHRCALAHAMADVQEDPDQELTWDLRALAAADLITADRAARAGLPGSVRGLYPSLHLNLAECYRKLGDLDQARDQLQLGQDAVGALGEDGYSRLRSGLDRLAERLG
ncbi:hypothetical protein BH20ACT5_BH20ACT5_11850 [soil metagenome]